MLDKAPEAKLGNLNPEFRGRRHRDHLHAQLLSSCSGQNLVLQHFPASRYFPLCFLQLSKCHWSKNLAEQLMQARHKGRIAAEADLRLGISNVTHKRRSMEHTVSHCSILLPNCPHIVRIFSCQNLSSSYQRLLRILFTSSLHCFHCPRMSTYSPSLAHFCSHVARFCRYVAFLWSTHFLLCTSLQIDVCCFLVRMLATSAH